MTRHVNNNVLQAAMELSNPNGCEAYTQVLQILLNEAMKIELNLSVGCVFPPSDSSPLISHAGPAIISPARAGLTPLTWPQRLFIERALKCGD